MIVAVYVTNVKSGTVHLVRQVHRRYGQAACGAYVRDDWESGDETVSGVAATCSRCRKSFGRMR